MFNNNDTPDTIVRQILTQIAASSDASIRIPSTWTPAQPIPNVPNPIPESSRVDKKFLDWLDVHLGKQGEEYLKKGSWHKNEAAKKTTNREISVSRAYMI